MKLGEARAVAHDLVVKWLNTPPDSVCVAEGHLTPHQTSLSDAIAARLLEVESDTLRRAAKVAGRRPRRGESFDRATARLIAVEIRGLIETDA